MSMAMTPPQALLHDLRRHLALARSPRADGVDQRHPFVEPWVRQTHLGHCGTQRDQLVAPSPALRVRPDWDLAIAQPKLPLQWWRGHPGRYAAAHATPPPWENVFQPVHKELRQRGRVHAPAIVGNQIDDHQPAHR